MPDNMFILPEGWEKVVYCRDCRRSYTPMKVPAGEGKPVIVARHCELFKKIVRDDDYCSFGVRRADHEGVH